MTLHDSETPAKGRQVITACALIWHDFDGVKKVFLPKRAATKKFLPNKFELPGGHIEFGEDIVAGLKRECAEELGMRISVGDAYASFTYTNEIKGSHSVEVVFFAKFLDPMGQVTLNPEDHSEYVWASLDTYSQYFDAEDEEGKNVKRGLELLNGLGHNFG